MRKKSHQFDKQDLIIFGKYYPDRIEKIEIHYSASAYHSNNLLLVLFCKGSRAALR